jgi:hypothetical protein
LPNNTSSEDITLALQELGYEVISVKQVTAKSPSPERGAPLVSLHLFLIALVRNQKSLNIFKISSLCNIIVTIEAYKSKSGLTKCYNCQGFGHCRQPSGCMWCEGGHRHRMSREAEHREYPKLLQLLGEGWGSPHPTNYMGCSYAKEELKRRKNRRMSNQRSSGRLFFSKYTTPKRSFASALSSSVESKQHPENQ